MHSGLFTGNKNGGGAVRLGLHFEGGNCQYFKTLVLFQNVAGPWKLLQLG